MSIEGPTNTAAFNLHPSQKDIYTDQLLNIDSPHYNIGGYITLKGALDKEILRDAVSAAPKIFDVFKMRFDLECADLLGYMDESYQSLQLDELDFSGCLSPAQEAAAWMQQRMNEPFEFHKQSLLFEKVLIKIREDEHWLFGRFHHLITDGYGFIVWVQYLAKTYTALIEGNDIEVIYPAYKAAAVDAFEFSNSPTYHLEENYWTSKINKKPVALLPRKYRAGKDGDKLGSVYIHNFTAAERARLDTIQQITGSGLQQLTLAALSVYYGKTTTQSEFVFGTPIHKRTSRSMRNMMGMFSGVLPFVGVYRKDIELGAFLKNISATQKRDYRYPHYTVGDFSRQLKMSAADGYLCQVLVNYEPLNFDLNFGESLQSSIVRITNNDDNTPLHLSWGDYGNGLPLQLHVNFGNEYFTAREVELLIQRLLFIINQFPDKLTHVIESIDVLPVAEKELLNSFNNTVENYPNNKSLTDLFEAQVEKTPEAIALVFEDLQLSYRQLSERANQLAHYLQKAGVQPDTLVPICIERGINMLVSILGVLKTGAAYIPIDPEYPEDRISYMLQDAAATIIVISKNSSTKIVASAAIRFIEVDGKDLAAIGNESLDQLPTMVGPHQLAYVIYTSGSTGKPKGVMIEHSSVINLLLSVGKEVDFNSGDVFLSVTTFSFDICYLEFFMPLISGGKLVIVSREIAMDGYKLAAQIAQYIPTHLQATPSTWQLLLDSEWTNQKQLKILIGGEPIKENIKESLTKTGDVFNCYGPTETTIWSTIKKLNTGEKVLIGKPIANTTIQIINANNGLVPIGVAGEICIAGTGLARGYLNRADLTDEKFIINANSELPGAKIYKTGDLGRWLPDGNIEHLGRLDDQVKIRGYRIELGEIETVLQQSGLVNQAVVVAKEDKGGIQRLVAYTLTEPTFDKENAIVYLRTRLPEYMVPLIWVSLKILPLTPNGKIDKKALPEPDMDAASTNQYIAPETEIEKSLAQIWQQLLGVERIGMADDFFELGGHSVLAMRLISGIRRELKLELSIKELFLNPTIAGLAKQLQSHAAQSLLPAIIPVQNRPAKIPLSFSQERLWFIDQLEGSVQYHLPAVLRLKGKLSKAALAFAFEQILSRHEVLRSLIYMNAGEGYQIIQDAKDWELLVTDGIIYANDLPGLKKYIQHLINAPFNLSKDYMLRAELIELAKEEYLLVVVLHHIAADGWSIRILTNEVAALYNAFEEKRVDNLRRLKIQYADYAIWQRNFLQGELLNDKLIYWKRKLQGITPLLLPVDYAVIVGQAKKGAVLKFNFDTTLSTALQLLSNQQGTTLFMTLLAAFKILLSRYSSQQDICVGTPIAGRQQQELESLIGFFVNMLALRDEVNNDDTFAGLLQRVKTTTLEAYEQQEVPFEKVVEAVVTERDMNKTPLFQVLFTVQHAPEVTDLKLGAVQVFDEGYDHTTTQFDLSLSITENESGLGASMEYCSDLFGADTISLMKEHFIQLLQSIVKNPKQKIASFSMIGAQEQQLLLHDFNSTAVAKTPATIIELFEQQVANAPDNIALVFEQEVFTYRELNEQANQLAHYLKKRGVKAESLVPICIDKSKEMMIGILATLKANGAFVPIDPAYPEERINFMLEDTAASLVLAGSATKFKLQDLDDFRILELDHLSADVYTQPKENPVHTIQPNQLAYIIYTSGSTGKPKGVMIEHSSIYNYLVNSKTKYVNEATSGAGSFIHLSYTFDASLTAMFMPLVSGKSIVIGSKHSLEVFEDDNLWKYAPYDFIKATPAHLALLQPVLQDSFGRVLTKKLVVGGEALLLSHLDYLIELGLDVEVINEYGPTEATVGCTVYSIQTAVNHDRKKNGLSIGKPIDNTRIYILGDEDQLSPIGVAGEICIGGAGLARGYLNLENLTAEKFIAHSFNGNVASRLYKTGDIGRWLHDGNIEYLGRKDDQVKIRGYRVELNEIENILQQSAEVKQAVVLAKEDKSGSKALIAYIVPVEKFSKESVLGFAKERLPDYMLPSTWMELSFLPLTSNGKIDKKALPDPDLLELEANEFALPRNEAEQKIATIWQDLLEIDEVGIHNNFFEVGGHSLLAVRVVAAIRKQFEIDLAINAVFDYPTIALLAEKIESHTGSVLHPAIDLQTRPEFIPLSFSQERLWVLDRLEGSTQYHLPAVLRLKKDINKEYVALSLKKIIERHESLRTVIKERNGEVYQYIRDSSNWNLSVTVNAAFKNDTTALQYFVQSLISKPFDLAKDYMLRADLIEMNADEILLVVTMHHIASDGWSVPIIFKEVVELYNALEQRREPVLNDLKIQYADYSIWQRKYLSTDFLNNKIEYWKSKLDGVAPLLLPADKIRPSVQSTKGALAFFEMDSSLSERLHAFNQQQGVTSFMTLLAAFNVLLYRYSGQDDICVGTPIANRVQQEVEELIGFFVNTLALRNQVDGDGSFLNLLQQVKQTALGAYENQELPFEKIVDAVAKVRDLSRSPLFQVMFVLQNTPEVKEIGLGTMESPGEIFHHESSKFELTLSITEKPDGLFGTVEYNTDLFGAATIQRMIAHFKQLLNSILIAPQQRVAELPMLTPAEQNELLVTFNDTQVAYTNDKSIVDLFEAQVLNTPANTAVIFEAKSLTYKELNVRSNQLAHYLTTKGVTAESLVPVCIERGLDMITGILAILKAGGAYVPIDPAYPEERIRYMLEDVDATIMLSSGNSSFKLPLDTGIEIISIDEDWAVISKESSANPKIQIIPSQLAYIIYTSGSTGKPKGVMIEHNSMLHYLLNSKAGYISDSTNTAGSFIHLSYTFDASLTGLFMPVLSGKSMVIASGEPMHVFEDPNLLKHAPYDFIKITPSHLELLEHTIKAGSTNWIARKLVIGGEALHIGHFNTFITRGVDVAVINEYGPTETTVGCSTYCFNVLSTNNLTEAGIPIGKPIDNTAMYILGNNGELVPIGVSGELYIAGSGLARGYLNRADLTGERFIKNPFSKEAGAKMYRTGDIGRWLPDGNIEYLGRKDEQVKIRGYRIELGEIESVAQLSGLASQVVVLARETGSGLKRLTGYVVAENGFDKEAMIVWLQEKLPEYMVPQLWVVVGKMPLTTNGKIDKKALPEADANELTTSEYIAPGNDFEQHMVEVWQKLLGIKQAGIHDNFFELGGDSILTIQVVSRMRRHGFELTPKDIFIHQTIAGLSIAMIGRTELELFAEQGLLSGNSGLLPIQQWYFEQNNSLVSHYNQSVLLGIEKSIGEATLNVVIEKLLMHHDALRFLYSKIDEGIWEQTYSNSKGIIVTENLQSASPDSLADLIKNKADEHQALLNITAGELVRVVLIETPAAETHNRLLLIIHHLVVDGVSWRILLEDFEQLLTAISTNQPLQLGQKSSSYRQWYQALEQYGKSRSLLSQKKYWQNTIADYTSLPVDTNYDGKVRFIDMAHQSVHLNADYTKRLLQDVSKVYHTEINDILLCALAITLNDWSGNDKLVIGLEGHGREAIADDIDTSRTVGWFTGLYPVMLEADRSKESGEQIKSIKEQLRKIPMHGIGYGVLKYINREVELQGEEVWEIVFNYLGQLDNVVKDSNWFRAVGESSGTAISGEAFVKEKLLVNSHIQSGKLLLNFSYSSLHYQTSTIINLADAYITNLQVLIEHCIEQAQTNEVVFTPSDYGLAAEISYEELDAFLATPFNGKKRKDAIETIYRLSGLQEGMLFHSLYDDQAVAYTEQFSCDLINPDRDSLVKSWQQLMQNHPVLRSGFYYDVFKVPVQAVYKEVRMPVEMNDYRSLDEVEQIAAIKLFEEADRIRGFDFESAPLMRLTLIRLSEDRYRMLWTAHHILYDGWSLPILIEELLNIYDAFVTGSEITVQEEDKYEDYIRFIERSNKEAEEDYWRKYLAGIEQSTLLPFIATTVERTKGGGIYKTWPLELDASSTQVIRQYAQQQRITVNTLMQGVWSLLLHRYTGSDDITFGVIVSGRPDELPNVEQRVGMYINTLPLHATMKANQQVNRWLQLLQEQQVTGRRYQYTPLREIQGWSGVQGDLFDSILVFENYPVSELIGSKQWSLAVENIQMHEQTNYPLSITIANSTSIKIGFSYNSSLLQDSYIAEIKGHFEQVLYQLVSAATDMVLSDADLLSAVEKNQLLQNFNDTKVEYPQGKTIVDLFEARAMKTPGNIALVFAEESLNYQHLNERSNQVAHYLKAKGVKEESLVPVCIDRSIDMVIAMLGIVKAGGAYVPIDPGYPQERIAFILEDTGATVVLTSSASRSKLVVGLDTAIMSMDEDWEAIAKESTDNPDVALSANSLAYVIYTSGSTGKPKGVMIEHSGVVNLINWHIDEYQVHQNSRSTSMAGVGFDAFAWEIWPYLSAGAGIYIIDDDTRLSYIKLIQLFIDNFITHSFLSTALVPEFVNESRGKTLSLHFLLTGGDKLTALDLKGVNYSVINNYGPTENSVVTTNYKLTEKDRSLTPPIGKPIANNFIQILDEHLQLLPVGVAGELCIGGAGLARGYLNRPDLTKEKFIGNPFNTAAGSRLYKTGDLCRWLPDGNLEYLGRIDDQVKIRGYRIELGEIENVLQQSGLVNQSVVLAKENSSGVKRLIAYVVVQNLFNREAVIAYLSSRLPDYMVPQLWVALERLPLTSNGKIDKKALPDLDTNELATKSFVAPRNEFEKQMAATWQQLLGLVNVGIEDNFFELGGDSILTIQVVSRMRRHGFELTPKDIFIHQNIAGLSAAIADKIGFEVIGEQGLLTGESGLLPIQQWYFEQDNAAVSHYNQSVLLGIEKSVGEAALSAVIEKLLSHHDALRFVYREADDGVWQQTYGSFKGIVVTEKLQAVSSNSLADLIKNKADEHQALLNIARGELVRIVLIETPAVETHNRLLLIIHHLVIDGVSWRILVEDFEQLLTAISLNQPLQPGSKSSSYRQWYQALELYGKSRNLLSQKEYWQNTIANDTSLPVDKNYEGKVRFMDMAHHSISLNSTATKRLLQEVPKVYHTEINDILLCALAITLNNWSGNNKLVIGLEGHGREDIADDIDTSRTVGWFTNLYPVLLETGSAKTNAEQIKSIKEQLRRIPMRGIGYGVLKYINREVELQGKDVWEVVFNYLGQLDNVVKDSNWFTSVGESSGAAVASGIRINEKLLVNSQVQSGELLLNFSYSSLHYEASTITNLAAAYLSNLQALIEHCIEQIQTNGEVFTPSDYGLGAEVGHEELDAFLATPFNGKKIKDAIESIYRLSGLQEGMLFHGLYDNEAGAYTEQFSCDLVKPNLDCLVKSWQHVIGNHSILRSGFYHDAFKVPVQCVYKNVSLPVKTIDYRELNESEQAAAIIAFETADRAKGFDFESAPLMRLTLIRLSEDRYRMLWTSHHILFDGWSLPILMEELLGTYESLVTEKEPVVQEEDKFEDYIRFVERQNKDAEEQYWRQHIAGLEQSTLLPFIGKTAERTKGAGNYSTLPLHLEAPITLSIRQYAMQHHITLNTLMQGVWSLLLHRYTGNNDIAFGVIVSGRPDELPNVEQRVGMYINTLPLHAKLQDELQLTAWLSRLQDQQVSGRKYQYTSLRQIQDWSGVGGDLFDSILVFENYPVSELIGTKQWLLEIENVRMHEQTNYPLSITIASAETIKIDFSYNTSLLQEIHVAEIRSHFEQVLNQFLSADAGTQLGEIELLTDAEKDQLLIAFNNTRAVYPADKSIISLFEEQVLITPEKIALVFEQERLSYRQLNDRSNQLAHYLAAKGVTIETLVPICIERGIDMMVAILGILKAGGAYVPIDPGYPAERIAFMLEDVAASMVLSSTVSGAKLPDGIDVVSIDADWDSVAKESISKLAISTAPNSLAYIIYTSGSTGKPKGVLVTNNNVVSLVKGVDYVSIKREDVLLSTGSSSFDATTFEYWSMLLNGGQLVLCAENRLLDNQLLKEEINTRAVNKMWFTSSWFNQLVETDISLFETLETILVGGEKLSEYHIGKLRQTYPAIEIINGYGPTENTTFSLTYAITESTIHQAIPIGRPLTNRTAYILDACQRLVPAGVSGEIYLSGDGLSRGYLNRPELTSEKFIKNPFASGLMYRTGDIGRWLPNGNIEYLGRIDDQVKIRGYRIELGEIETVIQQSELVSQAVIIVKDDLKGDKRLLAYIIPTTAYSKEALLAFLRTRLPEYMVPATWIELADFELTSNGKINKKALPDADAMQIMDSSYVAPKNDLEIKLASIWQEVLKLKQPGTTGNFFELGGHSLSAMRVVSAVRKELDIQIGIKDLFLYPSISSLAKYLQSLEGNSLPTEINIQSRPEHIPLSFSQERLWVIDRLEGSSQYHIPLILKLKGNLNLDGLLFALQTIVDRHEVLRTVFYEVDGKGFQSVKEKAGWNVVTKDGSHYKNDPAALKLYLEDLVKMPFDLSTDYPVRASLIKLDEQEFVLAVTMHHIASDAWSMPVTVHELVELYASFVAGRPAILAPLKLQYADYATWQRFYLQGKVLDEKTDYWKKKMGGVKPLQLTTDFKRPAIKTNNGSMVSFDISRQLRDQLTQLSQQQGVSLFMSLLATFKVLLHRYSGDQDICVGASVANRPQQELEGLIGFFVNTLALRTEVSESARFTDLLAKVKTTTIEALDHQDLPFEKVVEAAGTDRDASRSPLFQVMLVLLNIPISSELAIGEVILSPVEMTASTSKFDFTFHVSQSEEGLAVKVEYNTDLFREDTIVRMTGHFKQLLNSVVAMPEQSINSLQMLTDEEENALMEEFD